MSTSSGKRYSEYVNDQTLTHSNETSQKELIDERSKYTIYVINQDLNNHYPKYTEIINKIINGD